LEGLFLIIVFLLLQKLEMLLSEKQQSEKLEKYGI
jgi:hypothetical protein